MIALIATIYAVAGLACLVLHLIDVALFWRHVLRCPDCKETYAAKIRRISSDLDPDAYKYIAVGSAIGTLLWPIVHSIVWPIALHKIVRSLLSRGRHVPL